MTRGVETLYPSNVAELTHGLSRRVRASAEAYRRTERALWGFAILLIVVAGLLPLFASAGKILQTQQALIIGLLALSLNLLVNTTGLISFGHAMFFGFGAYVVAISADQLGWPALPMLAAAPVIGAISAFLIGFIVLRGEELYFALLTLGVSQLIWAAAHGWQSLTGGENGTTGVFAADYIHPLLHSHQVYWFIFGCVCLCALMLYVITRSPFGDALRGIRENRRRAEFSGLWVKRYELTAFVIAGTFGAIAGGLWVVGQTQITSTQINWQRSAIALIVVLIGGVRYFLGPFAGAIFYIMAFDYIVDLTVLWDTVLGIVVLTIALLLSGGLVGAFHWLFAKTDEIVRQRRGKPVEEPLPALAGAAGDSDALQLARAQSRDGEESLAAAAVPETNGKSVLTITDVSKRFGGLVAVDGVSLAVRRGEFHAIIGPNGAGKTTLFNVITGLMDPDGGTVELEGEEVTGTAPWRLVRRGMGRSFQQTSLFWNLSVLDNVTVAEGAVNDATLKIWGSFPDSVRDRAESVLDRVGLSPARLRSANELSHGDQRALEIASALAVESRLLLLDEPTAGLSPAETREAVALIKRIAREQGLTVLFVEHDMDVVFGIAERITVLNDGAVIATGKPEEIRANALVQEAYLGVAEDDVPAGTGGAAGASTIVTQEESAHDT